jgi:hypothetical protein
VTWIGEGQNEAGYKKTYSYAEIKVVREYREKF